MYQLPITGKELEDILIKNKADLYPCDVYDNAITVSVDFTVVDGSEIKFKSPVNCSQVTNLFVTCTNESKDYNFNFVDANGNNIGVIDNVFAEGAVIKVILDVTSSKAFIQNADTNSYIENTFVKKEEIGNKQEIFTYPITTQVQDGQGKYIDSSENKIVKDGCNVYVFDNPTGEHNGETVTIRTYIYGDMAVMIRSDDGTSLFVTNEGVDENSITTDPKKGIFEYTYTFNNLDAQGHDLTHFHISFCDNAYMDSPEIILHKQSVWEEIKRTQSHDHIVAQGTSGRWTYRKWDSGLAECWSVQPINCEWSQYDSFAFPFGFVDEPSVSMYCPMLGTACFVGHTDGCSRRDIYDQNGNEIENPLWNRYEVSIMILLPDSSVSTTYVGLCEAKADGVNFDVHVVGKWK